MIIDVLIKCQEMLVNVVWVFMGIVKDYLVRNM